VTGTVTWLGTVAGLIGIGLTYAQSRAAKNEARTAAEQASLAAQAVRDYEAKLAIANLAHCRARIEMIDASIRGGEFNVAIVYLHALRRDMESIFQVFDDETAKPARKAIATLATQIGNGTKDRESCKMVPVEKALTGLVAYMAKAEKRMLSTPDRKGVDYAIA
jgi:hypothetical protein